MIKLRSKILEAIDKGISNALDFNLDNSDSDSNDLYISKKKVNLDKEDEELQYNYEILKSQNTLNSIAEKLSCVGTLIDDEKEKLQKAIDVGCQYVACNDVFKLRTLIRNYCSYFGWNSNLNWINTSNVTNMSSLFFNFSRFNCIMSEWDVSNVADMHYMFYGAKNFNCDISKWDVSKVEDMFGMFFDAEKFNQPIGDWDVSNVENMANMFNNSASFNQDISRWDVSKVEDMQSMFNSAIKFNLPIGSWDVSNVENMSYMFNGAVKFNQDISSWDVEKVNYCKFAFLCCPIKENYKPRFSAIKTSD